LYQNTVYIQNPRTFCTIE